MLGTSLVALVLCAIGCGYDGPKLTVDELKAALDDPARAVHVIDVRPAALYRKGHVPGALSIPRERLDRDRVLELTRKGEVAVYCTCGRNALPTVKQLQAQGVAVILVAGGYKKWEAAGYPTETGN
jgi:rhodanese-related sulfurtransferase